MSYDWRREYEKRYGKLPDAESAGPLPQQAETSDSISGRRRSPRLRGGRLGCRESAAASSRHEPANAEDAELLPQSGRDALAPGVDQLQSKQTNQQQTRGGAAAARVAHNHEVAGSTPAPATRSEEQRYRTAAAAVAELRRCVQAVPFTGTRDADWALVATARAALNHPDMPEAVEALRKAVAFAVRVRAVGDTGP